MQVYSELDIFEEVVLYPDKFPNWSEIMKRHAEVCLNIDQSAMDQRLVEGEVLFEYVKAAEGKEPIALKNYFDSIYAEPDEMMLHPRASFILTHYKKEADRLTEHYGLVVQSCKALDDSVLAQPALFKDLAKGKVFEKNDKKGWSVVMGIALPPSNAMVIQDPYLLSTTNGLSNLVQLCDALLPHTIGVPYHLTVVSAHDDKGDAWRNKTAGDVNTQIGNLRTYPIEVEVVFQKSEEYHRRRVVLNYANTTCDKGFAVFKLAGGKEVTAANDVRFERAFNNPSVIGDSPFSSATNDLLTVKDQTTKLAKHIMQATGVDRGSIKGKCNTDYTLKNRLINDV